MAKEQSNPLIEAIVRVINEMFVQTSSPNSDYFYGVHNTLLVLVNNLDLTDADMTAMLPRLRAHLVTLQASFGCDLARRSLALLIGRIENLLLAKKTLPLNQSKPEPPAPKPAHESLIDGLESLCREYQHAPREEYLQGALNKSLFDIEHTTFPSDQIPSMLGRIETMVSGLLDRQDFLPLRDGFLRLAAHLRARIQ